MKKIKTTQALKELTGKPIEIGKDVLTIGKALAEIIAFSDKADMKMYILSQKLWTDKDVAVDDSDISNFKDLIRTTKRFPNQVTGQLLHVLEGLKEEK